MSRPVLLLTRPRAASDRFVASLRADLRDRVEICHAPLIEITPIATTLDPGDARGLVFSSANGVTVASAATADRHLPCFCVGQSTTRAAQAAGWQATCHGTTADDLVRDLSQHPPQAPLLHLSGRHTRGDISARLTAAGLETRQLAIYDQPTRAVDAALLAQIARSTVIAPLFSPRTARHFVDQIRDTGNIHAIALSPAVAIHLKPERFASLTLAASPDAPAMVTELAKVVHRISRVEDNP